MRVDALVALEPDQVGLEDRGERLGDLGLADAGLALEQQRAPHREREVDRRREAAVGQVDSRRERPLDLFDGSERHAEIVRGAIGDRPASAYEHAGRATSAQREAVCACIPASSSTSRRRSLDEALSILERYGDEAKVLAGGQSLIPLMKLRFASPRALVDINRIDGLDTLAEEGGALQDRRARPAQDVRAVGAARRAVRRARRRRAADLGSDRAEPRHRLRLARARRPAGRLGLGDAGGAAPRWSRAAPTASARSRSTSSSRGRSRRSSRADGDRDRGARPRSRARARAARYLKLERKVGDYATVGVAVHVTLDERDGRAGPGIALTGVGPTNIRADAAEQALAGAALDEDAIGEAAAPRRGGGRADDDVRGSAEYKRNVVRVFTERALRTGRERPAAGEEEADGQHRDGERGLGRSP